MPLAASHTRTVASRDPLARRPPSGENATLSTELSWPRRHSRGCRVGAVDLVGQVRRGRRERESDHVAAGNGHGTRTGFLR